ncbi:MAG: polysaccharide biosynthesis/export family protein [bacterium]
MKMPRFQLTKCLRLAVLGLSIQTGAMLLTGCFSYPSPNGPKEPGPVVTMNLVPSDELEIRFLGAPDLNTIQKIRRDGCISLGLIGDVKAEGLTPTELRNDLLTRYESRIQTKEITVIVRTQAPVFVTGMVKQPGRVEFQKQFTALQAIMAMGGFDETWAEVRDVVVIRQEGNLSKGYHLNFAGALKGKDHTPFYLQPLDIVYVPRKSF